MTLLRPLLPFALCVSFTVAQAPVSPSRAPAPPSGALPPPPGAPIAETASPTNPTPVLPPGTPATGLPTPAPTPPGVTPQPNPTPTPTPPGVTPTPTPPGVTPKPTLPPGVPVPGAVPPRPAGAPAVPGGPKPGAGRNPAIPLAATKIIEPIEKPTLNGAELAALYRKYTGRRVIVSAAAAAAEFSFMQDASPEDPLSYAQAAELLIKAAGIENFVFMTDVKDPNLDFLTVATRLPGRLYDVFNENDPLPDGDGVISYVMTFKHIKPEAAANAFTQIIGQFGTYGSIAPLNGAVVITENTSLIRRLIKLKAEIDKAEDIIGTRFISVKYSDVTELAGVLNDLLSAQQQAQKSSSPQRAGAAPPAPAVPGAPPQVNQGHAGGGASTTADTPVQIVPEPRTNRIFAMGRPVDLLFVEGLIREFDIESSEKTFLRRKLRFLKVADFLPVAENALTRAFSGTGEGGAAGGGAAGGGAAGGSRSSTGGSRTSGTGSSRSSGSSSRNSNSSSANNNSFGGGNSSFGGGNSSFGGGGGGGASLGEAEANTAPESLVVGRTLLVADNITNSVVVQGPPSGLEIVERLLDQIDVKADQVMISTVIGQLNLANNKEFGVDYFINGTDVLSHMGGGFLKLPGDPILKADGTVDTTANSNTFSKYGIGGGGLRAYGTAGDLSFLLKAVQTTGDFTVLARPSIFTANSQKGVISSGERIAIPTGSNSYGTGNASTQIQYQDVVLKLEVIPLINDENTITLEIALLSDEVNGNQEIQGAGANGESLVVPKITTREILTTVTIPNNNTIVLGGLITARKGKDVTGIPILSSIPFLGKLFATTTDKDERAELLVFIQPSIVNNSGSLSDVQADVDNRYRITNNIRKFADGGQGVLPPIDPAPPVDDKVGTPASVPKARPVETQSGTAAKMKKSIRSPHRK